MKNFVIIYLLLCANFSLRAGDPTVERVLMHTDKSCYVAGESIWVKFFVFGRDFQPSGLSKVGYVEICDTERPQMQLKLALENGSGAGKIQIPAHLPSGIYQLSGYTRFMRNEGEDVFFKKQIAIINVGIRSTSDRIEIADSYEKQQTVESKSSGIRIKTDKDEYGNRDLVNLALEQLPEDMVDMVVSVSRNDSVIFSTEVDKREWLDQKIGETTIGTSLQWLPEYEGHIITGRLIPETNDNQYLSSIAFVGKDICYMSGKADPGNGTVSFFTTGVHGQAEVVTSVIDIAYNKAPHRMDLITPFGEYLPQELPVMKIFPSKKQLTERYIGAQLQKKTEKDTVPLGKYYHFPVYARYDLDEYVRFNTISETILELIMNVRVVKKDGKRRIKVFAKEKKELITDNTLVLLDGVPIHDHEDILEYNPQFVKMFEIYDGYYIFGDMVYDGIVSLITHDGKLPHFQLSGESQLFKYDCPELPVSFATPDYSDSVARNSRKPDYRHTLYWNPFVQPINNESVQLSFYTSDLCGEFEVVTEGITLDGKVIYGSSRFQVKEKK